MAQTEHDPIASYAEPCLPDRIGGSRLEVADVNPEVHDLHALAIPAEFAKDGDDVIGVAHEQVRPSQHETHHPARRRRLLRPH